MKQNTKSEGLVAACCGRVARNCESVFAYAIADDVDAALLANLGKLRVILAAPPRKACKAPKAKRPARSNRALLSLVSPS